MKKALAVLLLIAGACIPAHAQLALYGTYTASNYHTPNIDWKYGPTAGVYWDPLGIPFVKFGADLRGSWIGSAGSQIDSYQIGPRIQLHPHVVPIMPYVEALGGVSHVNLGQGSARTDATEFSYALVAGLDVTIFPRLDWRVVDYSWGEVENLGTNVQPTQLSSGLVLRLP